MGTTDGTTKVTTISKCPLSVVVVRVQTMLATTLTENNLAIDTRTAIAVVLKTSCGMGTIASKIDSRMVADREK